MPAHKDYINMQECGLDVSLTFYVSPLILSTVNIVDETKDSESFDSYMPAVPIPGRGTQMILYCSQYTHSI